LPDEEEGGSREEPASRGDGAVGELRWCLLEAKEKGSAVAAVVDPLMNGSTTVLMGRWEQEVGLALWPFASRHQAHGLFIGLQSLKKIPEPKGCRDPGWPMNGSASVYKLYRERPNLSKNMRMTREPSQPT
jgi:hypothetical protein